MARFEGDSLRDYDVAAGALVVLSVLLVVGPTLVFTRQAWLANERAEQTFAAWGAVSATYMSQRLMEQRQEGVAEGLGSSELSSLMDASTLFDRVHAARAIPFTLRQVLVLAAASAASIALPLAAFLLLGKILQTLAEVML